MRALRATSLRLKLQPELIKYFREYAGPQCYPQLQERERTRANEPEAQPGPQEERPLILEQFKDCWMLCDKCEKRRLVKLECLPALRNTDFKAGASRVGKEDWREWLHGAEARYDAFMAQREHADQRADAGGGCGDRVESRRSRARQAP